MAIEVATAADLNNVRNNLSGDYIQTANIDMDGVAWTPISPGSGIYFTGTYNGNGFNITNISDMLFGGILQATITNTHVYGSVANNYWYSGLFAGEIRGSTVTSCSALGTVSTVPGDDNVWIGGFAGFIGDAWFADGDWHSAKCTIEKCYFSGTVTVSSDTDWTDGVGGFAGGVGAGVEGITTPGTFVSNCYSIGDVVGGTGYWVGGFVGETTDINGDGYIKNAYAACSVSGGTETGGFTGGHAPVPATPEGVPYPYSYTYCYYDSQVSGKSDTGKGTPRTTAAMTYPENFTTTYIDWDFTNIWRHDPTYTINDGYPHFGVGFNIWVKKSGVWEPVTDIWVKKGGVWQAVTDVSTLKGGSWNPV